MCVRVCVDCVIILLIPSRINLVPRTDAHFFKIYFYVHTVKNRRQFENENTVIGSNLKANNTKINLNEYIFFYSKIFAVQQMAVFALNLYQDERDKMQFILL